MALNQPLTISEDEDQNIAAFGAERNKSEVAQSDDDEAKSTRTLDVAFTDSSTAYFVSPAEYAAFDPANLSEQVILRDDHMVLSQGDRTADEQDISDLQTSASPTKASAPVASGAWLRVSRELGLTRLYRA